MPGLETYGCFTKSEGPMEYEERKAKQLKKEEDEIILLFLADPKIAKKLKKFKASLLNKIMLTK